MSKSRAILFTVASAVLLLPHTAPAQTAANISVVQGNGQLICDGCPTTALPFFDPLVVEVTDASGHPVPNATVTWTVVSTTGSFAGSFANATTATGSATGSSAVVCNFYNSSAPQANGETCNVFHEGSHATPALGPISTVVSASISNGQSVTFYLTQSPNLTSTVTDVGYIYAQLSPSSTIQLGTTISGPVNSVYSNGSISVVVQTVSGTRFPNVSVRLVPQTANQGGASISCQTSGTDADPGSVLTDDSGTANCVPVFGSTPSSSPENFLLLIGGVPSLQNPNSANSNNQGVGSPAGDFAFGPFRATATAVTPGSLTVVSGNSQTAQGGSAVANPLIVDVTDTSGNPFPGVTVTWSVSPANAAMLTPASGPTGSNGQAQTTVTLASSATGTVTVTASVSGLTTPATFTITVMQSTPTITGLSIVSGNNQSAQAGAAFAAPLVVSVTPATANITVNFAVTGGSGVLSAASAVTQSNGQASIGVTAGATAGLLTVVGSVGSVTPLTFSLTVTPPPPPISATSFLNGAGFFPTQGNNYTALSPCGIGTMVVGSPLATTALPTTPNLYAAPLQQTNGTTITFPSAAGTSAATLLNISLASSGQQLITFQVPCDATPSSASVVVSLNGTSSVTVPSVTVRPAAPGIFELISPDGTRRAVAVRANGSYVSPQNPAQPGEFVTIYVTGVGPTVPSLATGNVPVSGVSIVPSGQVIVGLDNNGIGPATISASPELIGVYQVNFQIPSNIDATAADHILAIGVIAQGNPIQFQQPAGSKLYVQ